MNVTICCVHVFQVIDEDLFRLMDEQAAASALTTNPATTSSRGSEGESLAGARDAAERAHKQQQQANEILSSLLEETGSKSSQ
jgi:hypothetical protein